MDALRISPSYTSLDWEALNSSNVKDWPRAAEIVRDRLEGRFLMFASNCLKAKFSGFVVLAIDCLLAETIQQFKEGITDTKKSDNRINRFLEGPQFQPDFDDTARTDFFTDIRCGLLHQAEAKKMWLIRRKQPALLQKQKVANGKGYIIDVERFHAALEGSLNDYLSLISEPSNSTLRSNLWKKMNHICSAREARGALYEPQQV